MINDDDHAPRECRSSTSLHGVCDKCGSVPATLHLPLRHHGWFCGLHCPECNPPGAAPTAPSAPTVITAGKFAGSLIAALSLDGLKEALHECSHGEQSLRVALLAERRRRWHAAHRARVLSRRQQSAARRGSRKQ
jgi:hypothetical protein